MISSVSQNLSSRDLCVCMCVCVHATDLVGAYKGLLKEKEALEASVKALSGAAQAAAQAASLPSKDTSGSRESLSRDQATFEDPLNVNGSSVNAPLQIQLWLVVASCKS